MATPKSQQHMLPRFRPYSSAKRMDMAVQLVLADDHSISEAARMAGVSRPRLSEHVKAARAVLDEQQERSKLARQERIHGVPTPPAAPEAPAEPGAEPAPKVLTVTNEVRRVPPFPEFAQRYFGNLECPDCDVHHEVPGFHLEMMEAITGPDKRLLINLPPYHAKSTVGTVQSTVYELCRDPNSRTLIVSKSQRLAGRFLYQISKYLSDPALYYGAEGNLIEDWGPFQSGQDWNKEAIYVAGRQSGEKDPSVSVVGVSGHIYGVRADRIIFDDIADLENQKNVERVMEMLAWCTQEAGSRVGKSGKLIFVGTRISAGDIYSHLQNLPAFRVIRYPAIIDEDTGQTLWPEHFPLDAAITMRESLTAEQWQLVYQNVDTPGFGASFPPDVVEACHDPNRSFGQYDPSWALVVGLDPAGAGEQAGFTALMLIGVDLRDGKRYLIDICNVKQMKAPQLRDQIFDWADRYPLRELRVESNGLQSQLVQYNQEIVAYLTNRGVRVVPHITTGHNKWDPNFGVEAMAPLFYNRQISLPTKTIADRNRLRPFEEQLISFPMGRTTDMVMAFWFAELGGREMLQRQILPMFDPRARMPARLRAKRRVVDFSERRLILPGDTQGIPGPEMFPGRATRQVQLTNVAGSITLPA